MRRQAIALTAATSLLVGACAPSAGQGSPAATAPATAAPASPVASPHGDVIGDGAVSYGYTGLRDWTAQFGGVALVELTAVGPVRWNTVDGTRPTEQQVHRAPPEGGNHPFIGRLISVRRVEVLSGRWVGPTEGAAYWRPGGRIGLDSQETAPGEPEFSEGERAIAFLLPQEIELGFNGRISTQIGALFPVDAAGRIQTLDPGENITLAMIGAYLP